MRFKSLSVLAIGFVLAACEEGASGTGSDGELAITNSAQTSSSELRSVVISPAGLVEEIYAFRTIRDSRVQPPTAFCANVGFTAFAEDQFTAYTYRERFYDGKVVDPTFFPIGEFHGCVGSTSNPDVSNFYMIGSIGGLSETELRGTCTFLKRNVPETGTSPMTCVLEPTNADYVGGSMITNTISSTSAAYQAPSFAHLRLWRKATERELHYNQ